MSLHIAYAISTNINELAYYSFNLFRVRLSHIILQMESNLSRELQKILIAQYFLKKEIGTYLVVEQQRIGQAYTN